MGNRSWPSLLKNSASFRLSFFVAMWQSSLMEA